MAAQPEWDDRCGQVGLFQVGMQECLEMCADRTRTLADLTHVKELSNLPGE